MFFTLRVGIHAKGIESFFSRWGVFSLTELTDLTKLFCALFNSWGVFSLTELTDLTERYCALFRTHRTPPAYRYHRGLSTKIGCNVL